MSTTTMPISTMDDDAPRGRIFDEDVRLVRDRVDLEAIVSEHVTLRPAGLGSMKGLCPFHEEKSPSFTIRPQLGQWHCFGCGEGGDAISFVQKIDGLPFAEAVEFLATRAGVTLRYEEPKGGGERRGEDPHRRARLLAVNDATFEFYRAQLMTREAATGRKFLADRGFDRAAADQFGIGYAPQGWNHLHEHLNSLGFTVAEQVTAGVLSEGDRGQYDRFRGRLIWPIRDVTGALVGFGARRLYDDTDKGPKYLNTPDSPLYRKSQVLYGIESAKKAIAKEKRVVVVEGYTDVMAARLSGVDTAVATCGTAFGVDHIRLVRRLLGDTAGVTTTGEVIFTFDGDSAGQKAAVRAFGEDQRFASSTSVAVAPGGQDPCELRLSAGPQAVRDLIENRQPLFAFVIHATLVAHNLTTAEGKVRALRATAPIVAAIRDGALLREYTRQLAVWLDLDTETVREAVRTAPALEPASLRFAKPRATTTADTVAEDDPETPERPDLNDPVTKVEHAALAVVLQHPAMAANAGFEDLPDDTFATPAYRAIHQAIRSIGGTTASYALTETPTWDDYYAAAAKWLQTLSTRVPDGTQLTELAAATIPADDLDTLPAYVEGMVAALKREHANRRITELRAELASLPVGHPDTLAKLASLIDLEQARAASRQDN